MYKLPCFRWKWNFVNLGREGSLAAEENLTFKRPKWRALDARWVEADIQYDTVNYTGLTQRWVEKSRGANVTAVREQPSTKFREIFQLHIKMRQQEQTAEIPG